MKAETPMFTMLLPIRTAPMNRSRISSRRLTMDARGSPLFSRLSIRAREEPVNAVSLAEKKADRIRQAITIRAASHRSMEGSSVMAVEELGSRRSNRSRALPCEGDPVRRTGRAKPAPRRPRRVRTARRQRLWCVVRSWLGCETALVDQKRSHLRDRDTVRDETLADSPGENEGEGTRLHLLILRHGVEKRVH